MPPPPLPSPLPLVGSNLRGCVLVLFIYFRVVIVLTKDVPLMVVGGEPVPGETLCIFLIALIACFLHCVSHLLRGGTAFVAYTMFRQVGGIFFLPPP